MRVGKTIGTVTLVEPHPTVRGGVFRVVVPLGPNDLRAGDGPAEPLVAFSEGGEAAQPFRPNDKPIDAFVAALIDRLDLPERPA